MKLPDDASEYRARLAELAEILAAGIARVANRKSSGEPSDFGECPLDISGYQSGHATPATPGEKHD